MFTKHFDSTACWIHIGTIQSADTAEYVSIKVDDVTASFKVDTGAEVSAGPVSSPRVPKRLQKVRQVLCCPGNQRLTVKGAFDAVLKHDARMTSEWFYVVESLATPLLGFAVVQCLKVVKFLNAVKTSVTPMDQRLFEGLGTLEKEYTT